MTSRDLDLVIWGATGFTGRLAVASLAGYQPWFYSCKLPNDGHPRADVKFAIAGRNEAKLQAVKKDTGCADSVPILIAEASDADAIEAFVRRTKVVVACSGPFQKYSDLVVAKCAQFGTHYVDITGELAWVRSVIDRYDDLAQSTGAAIVNMCGFDSIPFDLLALYGVKSLREMHQKPKLNVANANAYLAMMGFGFSGGSLATGMLNASEPIQLTKGVDLDDPFLLGGRVSTENGGIRDQDRDEFLHRIGEVPVAGNVLTGPSVMHPVNSRVVRRSAKLLKYGPRFNYTEVTVMPSRKSAEKAVFNAKNPAGPEVIKAMVEAGKLPKPGQGPTPEQRKQSSFCVAMKCIGDDSEQSSIDVACYGGEAGYEETARMVVEAGIQLAKNADKCPGARTGGVLTPAAGLGQVLIEALDNIGIKFQVMPLDEALKTGLKQSSKAKL